MEQLEFVDRRGTNCAKWDGLEGQYGVKDLHAMWVADMDIRAPRCVLDALHQYVSQGAFGYYCVPDSYYEAFIRWEKKHHGLNVDREWLRFSPGVVAGFNWCVQMLTRPQDSVIVTTPVYYPFLYAINDNGRRLISSDLINDGGVYSIDFDDFEKKITENEVKLFILCSPHNPVGRVWKREELARLFEICRRHNVRIVSDEIHQDIVFGDHQNVPALSIGDYDDILISLTAPSKTFNLAGAQNSFVIIPGAELRGRWDEFTRGLRVNGNAFGYIAAEAAYTGGEEWYRAVLQQIEENYGYLCRRIAEDLPGAVVSPLEGTYLAWIDLRAYVAAADADKIIVEKCRLAPDFGDWFGGERFAGFARFNLATSPENMKTCMDLLARIKQQA